MDGSCRMLVRAVLHVWIRKFIRVRTIVHHHGLLRMCARLIQTSSVYEAYYLETFLRDTSPSAVAWIGSIQACAQFSATVLSGPINDRYGPSVSKSHFYRSHT